MPTSRWQFSWVDGRVNLNSTPLFNISALTLSSFTLGNTIFRYDLIDFCVNFLLILGLVHNFEMCSRVLVLDRSSAVPHGVVTLPGENTGTGIPMSDTAIYFCTAKCIQDWQYFCVLLISRPYSDSRN